VAVSTETREHVLELFAALGHVTARRMMGGLTLYVDGRIFGIVDAEDRVFLKAADALADAMRAEGCERFEYARKDGRVGGMGYWTLPDSALDDPDEACAWARRSLAASHPDFS
jgi:DNA transformation protein